MLVSPFRMIGGKRRLLPYILGVIPEGYSTYVEPFAGGASLYWCLAHKFQQEGVRVILSDANPIPLWTFRIIQSQLWQELASRPWRMELGRWREIKQGWFPKKEWPTDWDGIVNRVYEHFYLTHHSVLGQGNSPMLSQKVANKRPKGLSQHMGLYHALLKGVQTYVADYREILWRYGQDKNVFLYIDPPYSCSNSRRYYPLPEPYAHRVELVTPHEVAHACRLVKGKLLISYDDSPQVRDAFAGYDIMSLSINYTLRSARYGWKNESSNKQKEILMANYQLTQQPRLWANEINIDMNE
jgi:DNA adenine methylase